MVGWGLCIFTLRRTVMTSHVCYPLSATGHFVLFFHKVNSFNTEQPELKARAIRRVICNISIVIITTITVLPRLNSKDIFNTFLSVK